MSADRSKSKPNDIAVTDFYFDGIGELMLQGGSDDQTSRYREPPKSASSCLEPECIGQGMILVKISRKSKLSQVCNMGCSSAPNTSAASMEKKEFSKGATSLFLGQHAPMWTSASDPMTGVEHKTNNLYISQILSTTFEVLRIDAQRKFIEAGFADGHREIVELAPGEVRYSSASERSTYEKAVVRSGASCGATGHVEGHQERLKRQRSIDNAPSDHWMTPGAIVQWKGERYVVESDSPGFDSVAVTIHQNHCGAKQSMTIPQAEARPMPPKLEHLAVVIAGAPPCQRGEVVMVKCRDRLRKKVFVRRSDDCELWVDARCLCRMATSF